MNIPDTYCSYNCKGVCDSLEFVEQRERESIILYGKYRDICPHPEVKTMLNELILRKQKMIQIIEQAKSHLKAKFEPLDHVQEM